MQTVWHVRRRRLTDVSRYHRRGTIAGSYRHIVFFRPRHKFLDLPGAELRYCSNNVVFCI